MRTRRRLRAAALALIVTLSSSCAFGVKHPAATAAIVGGTLGFSTCEIGTDFGRHGPCAIVAGGAALLLGGAVALAILFGGEGNTVLTTSDPDTRPEPPSIDDVPPTPPTSPTPAPPPPDAPSVEPAPDATPPAPTPPTP